MRSSPNAVPSCGGGRRILRVQPPRCWTAVDSSSQESQEWSARQVRCRRRAAETGRSCRHGRRASAGRLCCRLPRGASSARPEGATFKPSLTVVQRSVVGSIARDKVIQPQLPGCRHGTRRQRGVRDGRQAGQGYTSTSCDRTGSDDHSPPAELPRLWRR